MDVFIGNITVNTSQTEILSLLKGFAKKARVRMVNQTLESGERAYYAIAEFDSERLARKAIKKLNGTLLHGQQVVLREYVHRSYSNERRAVNWRDRPWDGPERRRSDRRDPPRAKPVDDFEALLADARRNEQHERENLRISAYSNMARKW